MASILLGENVPDLREALIRLLRRAGHEVSIAGTADDTLTAALAGPFDLVLMNPALPGSDGLDGLEVCRRLRAVAATARLPIMMLSVRQCPADVAAADAAGADDYLGKPFDNATLLARVATLVARGEPAPAADVDLGLLRAVREVMAASHLMQADEVAPTLDRALSRLGMGAVIFLIDHDQVVLRALPVRGREPSEPEPVHEGSLPGRAYMLVRPEPDPQRRGRLWVPLLDGTERFGVIRFEVPGAAGAYDVRWQQRCELIAEIVAHLIASKMSGGDILKVARRVEPMTVAAELMWQMLPPLTSSHQRLALSAIVQPCYDVGGEGYDYAVDGDTAWLVLLGAVGRGLGAAVAGAVALSAIRAARRAGGDLPEQVRAADEHLIEQCGGSRHARFVTGMLARFDLESGLVRYINAGSPLPVIFRDADLLGVVTGGARVPLGVRAEGEVRVGEKVLCRGDRMLLHTAGVTEARAADGSLFGAARLTRLAADCEQARLPAPETLRRLALAVAEHRGGPPSGDAAMVLVEWSPAAARRTVVGPPYPDSAGEAEAPS
ncbi:fused response regulator/phosphatase [Actinoplanes teichomyceticus]|uniref:Serine phosphatase RsbU (Regulator of sigma subunit) n=1 Tax=Actinoplanes teichomyceticus TaxID=1867 RepID=A0A561VMK3_ACTTI|nr:fused response regulator/phosphatase [Actinoplanes teichomyceticus]TWG12851.1 serine phosphatase RsbU (regulator of sigma subunit) [Actinoplanes teichomyceticus]GIF13597.1 hypothetical protein Ate01nite_36290 [Actinoplanes teichomyceticus]